MKDRVGAIISSAVFQYLCLAALLLFALNLYVFNPLGVPLLDLAIYFEAAERLAAGMNIYQHVYVHPALDGRIFELYYLYPPYLAQYLSKFLFLGYENFQLLWSLLGFAAILLCAHVVALLLRRHLVPICLLEEMQQRYRSVFVCGLFSFCVSFLLWIGPRSGPIPPSSWLGSRPSTCRRVSSIAPLSSLRGDRGAGGWRGGFCLADMRGWGLSFAREDWRIFLLGL